MKKLFYLLTIVLFISCSSGSTDDYHLQVIDNVITDLVATGTVSDQTPAQAKKTIYGKWKFSNSAKSAAESKASSEECDFDFIEFTDKSYIMSLILEDDNKVTVFGSYVMNEDSSGNVSSVSLNFSLGTSEITIATLTNIVVVEEGDNISATFTVDLSIPDDADFSICNSLDGDYNDVGKEEPMEASTNAVEGSNHEMLVNNEWTLVSVVENGKDVGLGDIDEYCLDDDASYEIGQDVYIEGCTPPTSIILSFSAFGSYTFVFLGGSRGTIVQSDSWSWSDDTQTGFYSGEDEGEEPEDLIEIISVTNTSAVFESNFEDIAEEGVSEVFNIVYTFSSPGN